MTLFDCYIAVDWSAANSPVRGKDSIWLAMVWRDGLRQGRTVENIATRREAIDRLAGIMRHALSRGRRVLAAFDFAFGYPAGFAKDLTGEDGWKPVWERVAREVEEGEGNRSNRFEVGSGFNEALGEARFWGKPHQHMERYPHLPAKRPGGLEGRDRRIVERTVRSAKSVFQLAYNGAVGSQTLLGIAGLGRLRTMLEGHDVRIWPFETKFADDLPSGPCVVLSELYPTLFLPNPDEKTIRDRQQVLASAAGCAKADKNGKLAALLSPPPGLSPDEIDLMAAEEGSILGAGRL